MERHVQEARADLPDLREILPTDAIAALVASAPDTVALPEVQPHHAAQIQYTSGTTGFPKGACLHHLGITNNARLFAERLGVDHESVIVTAMRCSTPAAAFSACSGPCRRARRWYRWSCSTPR